MGLAWLVAAAVAAVLASWAFNALVYLVWRPYAITRRLRAQGVGGPGYKFFVGNLGEIKRLRAENAGVTLDVADHDFIPMVQPHFRKWISLYGRTFVYWTGARPNVCLADVNAVKKVLSDRTGLYPKNLMNPHIGRLLGKGLVLIDGDEWKRHRKVVHPAFNMDKLKMMTVTMSDCARSMMSEWESQLAKGGAVEVDLSPRFEELTADVISHTAFGSSYMEGKQVFLAQRELQFLAFSTIFDVQIPLFRYLPTEKNLKTWKLDKQVRRMLMDIIKTRLANKDTAGYGNDLLGLMLEACAPEHGEAPILSMDEIIDEAVTMGLAWLVAATVAAVLASWAFNALVYLVLRPYAITRRLRAQGVGGPGYRFFVGNLGEIKRLRAENAGVTLDVADHDFIPMVQPHFRKWIQLYGRTFVYWTGARPNVCLADVNAVKQVLSDRTGLYPKNLINPHIGRLLGKGLVLTDGDEWKRHRKVVHPAFNMDKLKMMTVTMSDCARSMMSEWESQLAKGGAVEVDLSTRFEELTADVISHTAFGSSYMEGKQVFLAQRELQFLAFSTIFDVQIPLFRYLPTEKNLKTRKLDKQVRAMLMDIIKTRLANKDTAGYGNDLLGLMLEACAPEHGESPVLSMDEIIDECKTFFFAGHDTTSHLLTWASFLLSTHPEWQDKLREEVRRECGDEVPTGDMLNKLKLVNMFLLETLRLYGPLRLDYRAYFGSVKAWTKKTKRRRSFILKKKKKKKKKKRMRQAEEFKPLELIAKEGKFGLYLPLPLTSLSNARTFGFSFYFVMYDTTVVLVLL
ncbi:hypothetical protein EJB05_10998 [Eragrostis curvula]|uniref:Cytochrome P450 n=1 Tax=Eragrostis curvula TaxID=38414 RepID=A0A5J9VRE2_9POAL|nr:hypothetical protein EJB05_10998 [Eragrostis curvula]